MINSNLHEVSNEGVLKLNITSFFKLIEFVKSLCLVFDLSYSDLFLSKNITELLQKLEDLPETNPLLFEKYLFLLNDLSKQDNSEHDFSTSELFLYFLFYPAKVFENTEKNFDISSYDTRIDLYRNRVLDDSELRHQECSKSKVEWFEPSWWRIFVFKPLRESGISQEWLISNDIKEVIHEWVAIQEYSELRASIDFDDRIERDIDMEANKPVEAEVDGKTITQKPRNIKLKKDILRKKYYKKKDENK